ncbi:MAG: DUF2721 domain-containing protein [Acidobacteriota bacterium]|nr:DUF2721 domain-containing protein [Acidobacteriota bacterium]
MEINPLSVQDPLRVVTAAVTPVVMISASAILISGISSKNQSLSDRVRGLSAEFRSSDSTAARKKNIASQIRFFRRRLRLVAIAHISLYCAAACFVAMVMVISVTVRISTLAAATLPFFMAGVVLLLIAVGFEIRELRMSSETLALELKDINEPER